MQGGYQSIQIVWAVVQMRSNPHAAHFRDVFDYREDVILLEQHVGQGIGIYSLNAHVGNGAVARGLGWGVNDDFRDIFNFIDSIRSEVAQAGPALLNHLVSDFT